MSHSQGSCVARRTQALARLVLAGGSIEALTLQQAVLAVKTGVAQLLAAPSLVAVGTDAGAGDGVALGTIPTLAAVGAVRAPEVAFAAWIAERGRAKTRSAYWDPLVSVLRDIVSPRGVVALRTTCPL